MKIILLIGMVLWMNPDSVIVDFSTEGSVRNWRIVDDVVMGGRSDGRMAITEEGNAVFYGRVSLENNGGFSSVRHDFPERQVKGYHFFKIRLRGDGKDYQFRVRSDPSERHSYAYLIQTDGTWQTFLVPMAEMYPTWRGMNLDIPNYPGSTLSEIVFLVGNKKNEEFRLEIDSVTLVNR
jgi:hypothetical protein